MVDILTIALAVVSFGPAFLLMFYTLRDYTFPKAEKPFFDDTRVFMMFIFGIVIGMIFFFIDVGISVSITAATVILIALSVPLLQGLIKLVILNWPKFQRKVDTGFYGLALGMGIAATYSFSRMYYVTMPGNLQFIGMESMDFFSFLVVAMIGVQIVLIQGATTAMIGVGCARGQQWAYFANAMIYAIGFSLLLYGFTLVSDFAGEISGAVVLLVAWIICIYAYWHVHKIDLPRLIEEAKRGRIRRR